jgi:formylglycine-generating enzyme required for sulfatase activity
MNEQRSRWLAGARPLLCALLVFATARAAAAAQETFVEGRTGMEFVLVHGGTYQRGDFDGRGIPQESPAHPVTVSDFHLARREVTVSQFRAFVDETGYVTDVERAGGVIDIDPVMRAPVRRTGVAWDTPGFPQGGGDPVVWVTWNDAAAFADWLAKSTGKRFRLPTEAEWEYAAREGGRDLAWSGTSERERAGDYSWSAENSGGLPHAAGSKAPNALGLYDLTGNVWEWCLDWQAAYGPSRLPLADPRGPADGRFRVLRGGSWRVGLDVARTTYRNGYRPDYAHSSIGFRVALEADARI